MWLCTGWAHRHVDVYYPPRPTYASSGATLVRAHCDRCTAEGPEHPATRAGRLAAAEDRDSHTCEATA
jgi:hypothetical protein